MKVNHLTSLPWYNKIAHHAQLGGIETSVLDNGSGRGTRIAWVNTGSGLRYKVVPDRAMDIADASFNGYSLGWISPVGITPPQPGMNRGLQWLKTFGGGLLTTCGLSHFGGPESDEYGERSLHGLISNTPAEIGSIVQPDPANGELDMSISGKVNETQIFGPKLELKRKISSIIGQSSIIIEDKVINRGNIIAPHMLLYHLNFGWPLIDKGSRLLWKGSWKTGNQSKENKLFEEGKDFRTCPDPLEQHNGAGEDGAYIDIDADEQGVCVCGIYNQQLGIAVSVRFLKVQLPWLTNWQHWGKNDYVTGLEPGTNPPIGQAAARRNNVLINLEPGESRSYQIEIHVHTDENEIDQLLRATASSNKSS